MKRFIYTLLIVPVLCLVGSSCGVMFGGSKFSASIIAKDHPNAEIYVDGKKIGKGTGIGLYRRNRPLTIELKQEGCEPKTETFNNTFRTGNFILSCISWGLTGLIIDLGTGAAFKPDHIGNPAIQRMDSRNFVFMVDYSGCPKE
jgi:hypothetical protein